MGVDAHGHRSLKRRAPWTAGDAHGPRQDIYGSEGWGFESFRACRVVSTMVMSHPLLSPICAKGWHAPPRERLTRHYQHTIRIEAVSRFKSQTVPGTSSHDPKGSPRV